MADGDRALRFALRVPARHIGQGQQHQAFPLRLLGVASR
jgi:hypothetical protein